MKKKKIIVGMLILCFLCMSLLSIAIRAEGSQPTTHSVHDSYEFRNAVEDAKDGDIIAVYGAIDISMDVQIGSDDKHLTIQRIDGSSYLIFNYANVEVTNTVFEGRGIKSSYSWVTINKEAIFTNCIFQNFGSSEIFASSGSVGGAVKVQSGSCVFNDCLFSDNYALIGGHMAVLGDSQVELNHCTLKNGGAVSQGGAIANNSFAASCNVIGGEITGNQSLDFGGGISNAGTMNITGAKIYANSAVNGGADITTKISGNTVLSDTVEQMNELFAPDGLQITGWVCDYDFENGIYIPDVEPTQENALLKLDYSVIQPTEPESPTDSTEKPGEGDTEESGESGTDESTETEEPGGNETEKPTEGEEPTGTETPTDPSKPSEPINPEKPGENIEGQGEESGTNSSDSSDSSGSGTSTDNSSHTTNNNVDTDNSSQVTNTDNSTRTDSTSTVSIGDTTISNSTSSTADNSVNDSSSRVDNSKVDNRSDSNTTTNTTTTNNYYQTAENSGSVNQPNGNSNTYIGLLDNTGQAETMDYSVAGQNDRLETATPQNNIRIDAKGVDCIFEMVDGVYHISINSNQAADTGSERISDLDLFQIVQVILLVAILICMIWKPKRKEA